MPKPAPYRTALRWAGSCLRGGRLTILFLLLSSCDEVGRHDALTFFFDGVPPLPGAVAQTESSVPNDTKTRVSRPGENWRMHEPVKDCTTCHGNQPRRGASPKVQLVAPIPALCYQCHKEYLAPDGWVHGPVATGDCLLCHEPHKARTASLLRKPIPELCFRCHEPQAVHAIQGHAEPSNGHCVDCHAAHAAETKSLLKPAFLNTPAGLPYQLEVQRRRYEDCLQKAHLSVALGADFHSLCRTVIDSLEGDQLRLAQAYLEVLGNSQLVTDMEKPAVADVLRQVRALQEREAREHSQSRESEAALQAARQALAATVRALREHRGELDQAMTEIYYRSLQQYRAGQLAPAREGFRQVLQSGALPQPMRETARDGLEKIEKSPIPPETP